jgi:hypothetical protein
MKKTIFILLNWFVVLFATNLFATIGPIPLDIGNELPDGIYYGAVTVKLIPGGTINGCPGGYDGVKIAVDANQNVLIPGPNFGIQRFGFNYLGNTADLDISIANDPQNKWKISLNRQMGPFGVFVDDPIGTGLVRQDPLILTVCSCCADLMEEDVVVKNAYGYTFAVHIGGFSYAGMTNITSGFFGTVNTTLIELSDFTVKPGNKKAIVLWSTASEIDNVGFNIYRAESRDGEYVKINGSLIPAEGSSTQGAAYEFIDSNVQNRKTYYYKLQDVDIEGKSTFNGPASTTPRWIFGRLK